MRWIAGAFALILSVATPSAAQRSLDQYTSSFVAAMAGRSDLALRAAREATKREGLARGARLEAALATLYSTMVTFGRWDDLLREPLPSPELRFATAIAYYARGAAFAAKRRWAEASASLDTVVAAAGAYPQGGGKATLEIAAHALAGEVALRREEPVQAVRHFQAAVDLEDRLTDRHPPTWYYPTRQSLGKALLTAGRPAEAERVYREDLARFPENGWSLFGLAQALAAQGRPQDAAAVGRRFRAVWQVADVALEASRF